MLVKVIFKLSVLLHESIIMDQPGAARVASRLHLPICTSKQN